MKMPVLFIGHGSPLNAIENNTFTQAWRQQAKSLPPPKAIVVISAHWYTEGVAITTAEFPKTIHDFYGFPPELFAVQYPAKGNPELAKQIQAMLAPEIKVIADNGQWGFDHGAWSILVHLFPNADIPVIQLSIDGTQPHEYHFQIGQKLQPLREQGILIIGSGNIVHNLRMIKWQGDTSPYPWATAFNTFVKEAVVEFGYQDLINYQVHKDAKQSVPTEEHYLPFLYILGCRTPEDKMDIFADEYSLGSLSMTSFKFH